MAFGKPRYASMDGILLQDRLPLPEEWEELRRTTNWGDRTTDEYRIALQGTLFGVCALDGQKIVAMARVVGDGALCFQIQDVIVDPSYQGKGIGTMVIEHLLEAIQTSALPNSSVYLFASKGKEAFYRRFGFLDRPCEDCGPGMALCAANIIYPKRCK